MPSFNPLTIGAVRSAAAAGNSIRAYCYVSIPSLSGQSVRQDEVDDLFGELRTVFQSPHYRGSPFGIISTGVDLGAVAGGFNPLTIGAVRSASARLRPPRQRQHLFQSPHYRGSPFGLVSGTVPTTAGGWKFQSPHYRGSPFGIAAPAAPGSKRKAFQSPHYRGSPFGV